MRSGARRSSTNYVRPEYRSQPSLRCPTIGNLRYKRVYTVQDKHGAKILIHIQQHIYEIHEKRLIHDNNLSWISRFSWISAA